MRTRFRISRRGCRGDKFYCVDTQTSKRVSLGTADEDEAQQIIEAKNTAERQPVLNLQIAKAYLASSDSGMRTRTWQDAVEALTVMKQGANRERWLRAAKDKAFAPLIPKVIIETHGELLLRVLQLGKVSANVYLRRLHNFCLDISKFGVRRPNSARLNRPSTTGYLSVTSSENKDRTCSQGAGAAKFSTCEPSLHLALFAQLQWRRLRLAACHQRPIPHEQRSRELTSRLGC
jgi:hypothetical protein